MLSRYDIVLAAFPFTDGAAVRAELSLLRWRVRCRLGNSG
ncbi:hypothetical protein SynBMKMC1_02413 [Synechococcus sp. BMK-MC-1]|nr:hypothetical protein SynBMKMC1_02413 [Synechococcus sp. BMK-MC-1]